MNEESALARPRPHKPVARNPPKSGPAGTLIWGGRSFGGAFLLSIPVPQEEFLRFEAILGWVALGKLTIPSKDVRMWGRSG